MSLEVAGERVQSETAFGGDRQPSTIEPSDFRGEIQSRIEEASSKLKSLNQRGSMRSPLKPESDGVLTAITKLGGVSRSEAIAQGIDPAAITELRKKFPYTSGPMNDGRRSMSFD